MKNRVVGEKTKKQKTPELFAWLDRKEAFQTTPTHMNRRSYLGVSSKK